MIEVQCAICNISLKVYKYRLKRTKNFYCNPCHKIASSEFLKKNLDIFHQRAWEKMRNKGLSDKQLKALAKGRHKGKTHTLETRNKISKSNIGKLVTFNMRKGLKTRWGKEDKSPHWKGDDVGYVAMHNWVYRQLGRPDKCEHCNIISKKLQWANKSQAYKRELTDWIRLCVNCHKKYDSKFPLKRNFK